MSNGLYGIKKASKISGKEISSSNSASFSSNLASLISGSSSKSAKTNTTKSSEIKAPRGAKENIFTAHKAKKRSIREVEDDRGQRHKTEDEIGTISNADLQRSKRRMEEKVRLYNAMKRGEYVQRDDGFDDRGLVDFDRKWAEKQYEHDGDNGNDSSSHDSDHDEAGETVTYTDEFGRTRTGTRKQAEKVEREKRIAEEAAIDLVQFAAHPEMPSNIIYGDAVQHQAFNPERDIAVKMAELAQKRDRPATPPPDTHFDATAEVRTKGTAFYAFSHDAEARQKEMDELEVQRQETERIRKDKEEQARAAAEETRAQQNVAKGVPSEHEEQGQNDADRFLDTFELESS